MASMWNGAEETKAELDYEGAVTERVNTLRRPKSDSEIID